MIIGVADRFEDSRERTDHRRTKIKNSRGTSILVTPVKPDSVAAEKIRHARVRGISEAITTF
jgi:hypothetical protein